MRHVLLRSTPALVALLVSCNQDYELKSGPVDVDPGEVTECGFTQVEDTPFYAYDCNPVFTTTGEDWAPSIGGVAFGVTEVVGHPFYQAWYIGSPEGEYGDYGLGYAVSPDGTEWEAYPDNPLITEPDADAWDGDMMDAMQVVWDPDTSQYVMLYQGYNIEARVEDQGWGLGVATSPDGRAWDRLPANPVIDFTEPADVNWCWPLALTLGSVGGYTGYIAGSTGNSGAADACEVYRIDAGNLREWTPDEDVVLEAGDNGTWDDEGFASLAIAELAGERYAFYVGFGTWVNYDTYRSGEQAYFGYAKEVDGRWVRQEPGPVPLHVASDGLVRAVGARTVGRRIHLWITDDYDGVSGIGYFLFDPFAASGDTGAIE